MRNKLYFGVAALAALGFTGSAMASDTDIVTVNIKVDEVVSMWSNEDNINLTMDGFDANNLAVANGSLSVINNVDARVDASVTGTLPPESVPGGGIQFFIFDADGGLTTAEIQERMCVDPATGSPPVGGCAPGANAYNPTGAAAWNIGNMGATQTVVATTGVNNSIKNLPLVYAAAAPGELPDVNMSGYNLTVTYTIIP